MNIEKYRKLVLQENWNRNRFIAVQINIYKSQSSYRKCWQHQLVLCNNAFWVSKNVLCIGYELRDNREIFRPIFSHKRQRLIDKLLLNFDHTCQKFWNKINSRYFINIAKIKILPLGCVRYIVQFIH